ncbi:hypothetical protein [Stenotrophomonas maltophilia]|uniref:hypothetical protein n=1 Tax=Stenotrophomonas maltophilia TaxID=40324 RepID=UPI0034DAF08C
MPQKFIDQTTIQPDGSPGDDAFTAFATCNDNFQDAEGRLSALEGGSSNIGQDVADLKSGLQQEKQLRADADGALSQAIAAEVTARQNADDALSDAAAALGARFIGKNRLINGSMRWWQRGTSFTSAGYSVDRWFFNAGGVNTPSLTRNPVTPGDVSTECIYFAKIAYGSVTDAANHYVVLEQRMENVTTLAGLQVAVSFIVFNGGAAGRQIAVEFVQSFGTGGSTTIQGIGATKYSLVAGLNVIKHTTTIPSIAGKTLGANNFLCLTLWATGGSNFNARNASLGAQAGDVHFTQVQVETGASATEFEARPDGLELALCQRFYETSFIVGQAPAVGQSGVTVVASGVNTGTVRTTATRFAATKRAAPAITLYPSNQANVQTVGRWALFNGSVWNSSATWSVLGVNPGGFIADGAYGSGVALYSSYLIDGNWVADAEI